MKTENSKNAVAESYGQLAKVAKGNFVSKLFACCDLTSHSKSVATAIGYSKNEIEEVPEHSNLGIGCGNPSSFSELKLGDTVVDLGSGAGFDAFICSRQVGASGKVLGIDLSEEMVILANQNAVKGNYQNTTFLRGDIEALPLENDSANHVISNCVINLSQRKQKVFQEAYRVIKPGGKLAISDIVLERELPEAIKNSLAGQLACISGAEKLDVYLSYIREAGFKEISIVDKKEFPLELILLDPQVKKIVKMMNFDISSDEAKDLAARVKSISIVATK